MKKDVKTLIREGVIKGKKTDGRGKNEEISKSLILKLKRAVVTALFCYL
jgi:hypothetical protein